MKLIDDKIALIILIEVLNAIIAAKYSEKYITQSF